MPRRDETPRDLLYGLLAMQIGLIDQEQLLSAFGAWSRSKGKTLAEILLARGAIDAESNALLEGMARKQLERHGGDAEKSLAAVTAGPSTREKLAALGDMDLTASVALVGSHTPSPDATATMSIGTATSDGQRFRVLRPHAQGGLGAVFVALDGELNREVALKQILDHHADDHLGRTRFLLEAEITGGLEHPGIVPVYGLGHYADGRPYYAMRFIRGDSLKEAIAAFHADGSLKKDPGKRSLALRKLLRRFVDVCNAIDYAHGRGILHRDLKPGNVIVGKYGETLVVDWGLAKPMGHAEPSAIGGERTLIPSSSSGSAETLPGSAIGTPAYMSPEQAAGDLEKLGPRSDVYSLGATLYCLLTGQAPFEGTDLGTVLREVQKGSFPPPRQVDASIDKALEAVRLKAMETRPEDRHATARSLADDVERWAADEPTSAWAEPATVRIRRWMRRNRTAVSAAVVALVAGVVGLATVLAVQTRARNDLAKANGDLASANGKLARINIQVGESLRREERANTRLAGANTDLLDSNRQKDAANAALAEANGRVQARFDLARDAIRSFKSGVEEDEALKEDRLKPLRDKLLGSARQFYDKLGALLKGQPDAASKAILAESYIDLGDLIDKIGQKPEALAAYKQAVALRRELAALPGAGPASRIALAEALNEQGWVAMQLVDHAGALAVHEEARALAGPLATGPGATIEARRALGSSHQAAGEALKATGKIEQALASYRLGRDVREAIARDEAAVPRDRRDLAVSHNWIGLLHESTGDVAGALAEQRRCQELMRALVAEAPAVAQYRHELAISHARIGFLLESTGDVAGALAEHRRNQELMRDLVAEAPAVAKYRRGLAVGHSRIGGLLQRTGDSAGAMVEQRRCQELMRALAAEAPVVADYRSSLANSHGRIGLLLTNAGDTAGALAEQRKYQELVRALAAEAPAIPGYRSGLANSHQLIGSLLRLTGDTAAALAEFEQARFLLEALVEASPKTSFYRYQLSSTLILVGNALEDLGRIDEARDRYARVVALREAIVSAEPKVTGYRTGLANGLRRLAWAKLATGDVAGAVADARRAVDLYEGLPSRRDADWFGLACARATLADAAGRDGPGRSAPEAANLAGRAMANLSIAVAMGLRNLKLCRQEPALDPLRGRADFRLLMLDLAFPVGPFAR